MYIFFILKLHLDIYGKNCMWYFMIITYRRYFEIFIIHITIKIELK